MNIEELKEDYDWREALVFADFNADGIKEVLYSDEGYNDGDSWILVVELNDGRFGYVSAWCDYTGWDCQAGGHSEIFESLNNLIRFGLTKEYRQRLGLVLEDLDNTPTQYNA